MSRPIRGLFALLFGLLAIAAPARGQQPADSLELTLRQALDIGLQRNPQILIAGYNRSAAGAGLWDAYGNFLPRVNLSGQFQRVDEGTFFLFGSEFQSPRSYNSSYSWDLTHSLLDSGRDIFRLKSARANVDQAIAGYDLQSLATATEIETQYLEARRQQALVDRSNFEVEQRRQQLALAQGRYDVGAVTRSDVLQGRLELNRAEVAVLQANQRLEEARLALRSLLGGEIPDRPLDLTTDFQVFDREADVLVVEPQAVKAPLDADDLEQVAMGDPADAEDEREFIARKTIFEAFHGGLSLRNCEAVS